MLVNTYWTNIYRVTDYDMLSTSRPIFENTVAVHPACAHLGPGGYWIDWQTDGNLSSGPWANPITILGQTTTGNGLQSLDNGVTWAPALDSGSSTRQGLPFRIFGTAGIPTPMFVTHVRIRAIPARQLLRGIVRMGTGNDMVGGTGPGAPVGGARVAVEWTIPAGNVIHQTRRTNARGLAFPVMLWNWPGTYILCVSDATHPGYYYDPSQNWETCAAVDVN